MKIENEDEAIMVKCTPGEIAGISVYKILLCQCRKTSTRRRGRLLNNVAKREEQIACVMQATVGMYGDLQGIAGKTLQEIEGLELRALNAPTAEAKE